MTKKYVYLFNESQGLGKELLGGKGAGLAEMASIGILIPQGFTITTEACVDYYNKGKKISSEIIDQIKNKLAELENITGKKLGGTDNPLLVSVRSGARVSMPGMMDTILNLGLNEETVQAMARITNNERFAYDSYRRFILMFTNIAKGFSRKEMDGMLEEIKQEKGYKQDCDIPAEDLKELIIKYKEWYKKNVGEDFPNDPWVQLIEAVSAVFSSWDNERAIIYRRMNGIPSDWGTAVNVQSMVFGNKGETSGTGVGFSRNPSTGEKQIFAEYLVNAQGEDVVAGIRTPLRIEELEKQQPAIYKQYVETSKILEAHYKDMQDMEFTVEDGKLYFLQTRNGKRTATAALKIACDLVDEGIITKEEALSRIDAKSLNDLLHPTFKAEVLKKATVIAKGNPASPGAGTGKLAFSAQEAKERKDKGENVILVREETSPEDIIGMVAAQAVLTARGGMTSHAAVVARGMGKCAVTGCSEAFIDEENRIISINGKTYGPDDVFSVNGFTGEVYAEEIEMVPAELSGNFQRIMSWADEYRALKVRCNADSPKDAINALKFGAEGIGLCRTEHMFFGEDRIFSMRKMILAKNKTDREAALNELLPYQKNDFKGLFMAMKDLNVNIRLLDPPLHEFLPQDISTIMDLADALNISTEEIQERINDLHEFNPMMGFRGDRLAIAYPEIARMQAKAIILAAIEASKELGIKIEPEIMIPFVIEPKEIKFVKNIISSTCDEVINEENFKINYHIGTMIEIPRAALLADEIAEHAEFFSFGTNDLTQMTMGFSRDDSSKFLPHYYSNKILEDDPFQTVDIKGVGKLIQMASTLGRQGNKNIHLGVCGETGGDPRSIEFYHNCGLDYVSCSPYRVPVAKLAAAQAAIKNNK
ncbi:MAG: pyruvate, phosphate dikinase [Acholeplasmatales bacterium]|nr:pyruvate, phosphate dikinase [Acholeplasmatales bacterium]